MDVEWTSPAEHARSIDRACCTENGWVNDSFQLFAVIITVETFLLSQSRVDITVTVTANN